VFLLVGCRETLPNDDDETTPTSPIDTEIPTIIDDDEETEIPSIPIETVDPSTHIEWPSNYVGYANNISITETVMPFNQRLPQKYFTGTYSNIKYTALTQELCLTAHVIDAEYQRATYYIVGRKAGTSFMGEMRIQFLVSNGIGQKRVCFDRVDLSDAYEVLLTKIDLDDLNPSNALYSVNTLTLIDLKSIERNHITQHSLENLAPLSYEKDESPYISFSSYYNDQGKTIDKVHVVLFDPQNDSVIDFKVIDIDDSYYDQDILKLDSLRFDDVSPGMAYSVQIFADGHDGVDSFEKVTIGNYSYTSSSYDISTINTVFHGLFAAITGIEVVEDTVHIYYAFANSDDITYSDTSLPITLVVTTQVGPYGNSVEETFPLDLNTNYMTFPRELLVDGLYLSIRDSRLKFNFCDFFISPYIIDIAYYPSNDKLINLNLFDISGANLLSIKVDIIDANQTVLETIENVKTEYGHNSYPYVGRYSQNESYMLLITYEVDSLIGVITHTLTIPIDLS
jgi:hypothetical protein